MSGGPYVTCPKCQDITSVYRVPEVVGRKGIRDFDRFKCNACNFRFSARGGTWWESLGRVE